MDLIYRLSVARRDNDASIEIVYMPTPTPEKIQSYHAIGNERYDKMIYICPPRIFLLTLGKLKTQILWQRRNIHREVLGMKNY